MAPKKVVYSSQAKNQQKRKKKVSSSRISKILDDEESQPELDASVSISSVELSVERHGEKVSDVGSFVSSGTDFTGEDSAAESQYTEDRETDLSYYESSFDEESELRKVPNKHYDYESEDEEDRSRLSVASPVSDITERSYRKAGSIQANASTDSGSEAAVLLDRSRSYQKNKLIEREIEAKASFEKRKSAPFEYKPTDYYDRKIYDEFERTGSFSPARKSPLSSPGRSFERTVSFKGVGEEEGSIMSEARALLIKPPKHHQSKQGRSILKREPKRQTPREAPEMAFMKEWFQETSSYMKLIYKINCTTPQFSDDPEPLVKVPNAI